MYSIIIPTLNEQDNIVNSIQQFDNYKDKYNLEIIVSDSRSIDNTVSLSEEIADKVIIYNKNDKCNISKARNFGAKFSSNPFLIFLDADIVIPDIDLFFNILSSDFKKNNLIAASPSITVDPLSENLIDKIVHFIISLISRIMNVLGFGYARGGCQIINAKHFNLINGYNENYVAGEDVDIFRRIRKYGKTSIINNLNVYESPRRYRRLGYLNVLFSWFMNWLFIILFKKTFSSKW